MSDVGVSTAGLDDALGATVEVVSGTLVLELGDPADALGMIELPSVVTVALAVVVTVAVRLVVVVGAKELASVAGAGGEAGGVGDWGVLETDVWGGDATLDAAEGVAVLDADGRDVGTATLGDRVGARVGVGVPGFDGRLAVGTPTVGRDDRAGVGSPEPSPPVPHPAAATTVINNAATTATRMAPPSGMASPEAHHRWSPRGSWTARQLPGRVSHPPGREQGAGPQLGTEPHPRSSCRNPPEPRRDAISLRSTASRDARTAAEGASTTYRQPSACVGRLVHDLEHGAGWVLVRGYEASGDLGRFAEDGEC